MSTWSAGGVAPDPGGRRRPLCRRRHPPVRPPGLVGDPHRVRFGKSGSARRSLVVLRALLAAVIASAALLGAAVPALAGQQPPPTPPTPSQPPPAERPPEQQGLPVSGTLRNADGTLLSGVQVRVFGAGGQQVSSTTSDSSGRWELTVPAPGRYTFRI